MGLIRLDQNAIPEQAEIVLKNIEALFKNIDQLPEAKRRISRMEATVNDLRVM